MKVINNLPRAWDRLTVLMGVFMLATALGACGGGDQKIKAAYKSVHELPVLKVPDDLDPLPQDSTPLRDPN